VSDSPGALPYGSWPTPIDSELVVQAQVMLGEVALDGDAVWWSEQRPEEGGRTQLVCLAVDGERRELLPPLANVRTSVHEYGGGAWWVHGGTVWYAEWDDQRLHRVRPSGQPEPITLAPAVPRGDRWADGDVHPDGRVLAVVRERHPAGGGAEQVVNEIVLLPSGGGEPEVLVSGPDFVSDPRWSPDGETLCWLEWDHPDMPWDSTRLRARTGSADPVLVAGGPGESVFQPRWAPDGALWFCSDRSGWWNLYRRGPDGSVEPMVGMDAEIGTVQWVFGQSRYAFLADGRVVFAYRQHGQDRLAVRAPGGAVTNLDLPYTVLGSVQAAGDRVVLVAASATSEQAVVRLRVAAGSAEEVEVLRAPRDLGLSRGWYSSPEHVRFPSAGGRTAFALFYPPTNPGCAGPPDELPPLLVLIHGGPTGYAPGFLRLAVQYWTSRGFAVVDVDYGGSAGYGRAYRKLLEGTWGIVDVEDCVAAARWLADQGRVDPDRLCIRGGSAGGYTTLAVLASHDLFAAGGNHYGVADLEALAKETHKFESRYLDGLVGPYPQRRDIYLERSPINHVDSFETPLVVFQGLEDEVVPPAQSRLIVDALRTKGVPVAYVEFAGEQHGFRGADAIRRSLDGELSFYAQVLGFPLPPDENIAPITVDNL